MFSSQVPSSSTNVFSPSSSFFDTQKDNLDSLFSSYFVCHPPQNVIDRQFSEDHDDLLESVVSSYNKKMMTSKKNGRNKICTAKGLRDRRVRLSIDISRKFFCLQDLLGFDKASKTLDWLFTKSLTTIKDLVEQTNHSSSSTLTNESKAMFLETIKEDSVEDNRKRKKSQVLKRVDGKIRKMTQRNKAKSRAEARARARKRTKEKLCNKTLDGCGQNELQNGDKGITWEFIMDQETSKNFKDSSFQGF